MAKARRTPPLFEVLRGQDRRTSPGTPGKPAAGSTSAPPRPVEVRTPASGPSTGPDATGGSYEPRIDTGGARLDRRAGRASSAARWLSPTVWALIAVCLAAVATTWYVAYRFGQDQAAKDLVPKEPGVPKAADLAAGGGVQPSDPQADAPDRELAPQPGNPVPAAPILPIDVALGDDPRQPGMNYLHIVTLTWRDAEQAVAFLNRSGVRAVAIPARKVDPKAARDKNAPHLIFAAEAIPSDRFKASATQRNALIEKVKRVGQRFRKEEKGASDFAEPYWAAYQGK